MGRCTRDGSVTSSSAFARTALGILQTLYNFDTTRLDRLALRARGDLRMTSSRTRRLCQIAAAVAVLFVALLILAHEASADQGGASGPSSNTAISADAQNMLVQG